MSEPDQYLAVVVVVLFVIGLIVIYLAARQRSSANRDWDTALVGVRGPSAPEANIQKSGPSDRS